MTQLDDDVGGDLRIWMAGYQRGEIQAFDHLYGRLAPSLRRCLNALARDPTWVDDLLQETFLQMHRARQTYNRAYPVRPWALAIARHVFLMARRARGRRHGFDGDHTAELDRLSTPGHEQACLARDQMRRILTAVAPSRRRAVLLHHGYGFNFDEVGQALGIGDVAAKLRVSRAVASVRRHAAARRRR
jgi:RNA polymerase sigma-70 factor (ECF subfamily)